MGEGFDPVLKGGNNADRQEGEKVVWFFDAQCVKVVKLLPTNHDILR